MSNKRLKLLLIDDEKDICSFEKSYFEKHNFSVSCAYTGLSGVKLARKQKPDIALIDIYLSKRMDGIQTLQKLLKLNPECKCIMTTWDKERALEAKKLGAVDILIKPTEIRTLEKAVFKTAKQILKTRS